MKYTLHFLPFFLKEPIYLPAEPPAVDLSAPASSHQGSSASSLTSSRLVSSGDNQRQILVLIDEAHSEAANQLGQLLLNILNAVHLSMKDILLVNLKENEMPDSELVAALEATPFTILLTFGVCLPEWYGTQDLSPYTIKTLRPNQKVLLADALRLLATDPHKKKSLWICLQRLFGTDA